MSKNEILTKLHSLHEMRKEMTLHSMYHGCYVEKCVALNLKLKELTGKNYVDFSKKEIEKAIVEYNWREKI